MCSSSKESFDDTHVTSVQLQANKKAHEEAIWRETSPLTDLDEDDAKDITHLKERLEQQEGEISELRRALAESKRQAHRSEPQSDRFPRLETCVIPALRRRFVFLDIFAVVMQPPCLPGLCMVSQGHNQDHSYLH